MVLNAQLSGGDASRDSLSTRLEKSLPFVSEVAEVKIPTFCAQR